MAYIEITAHGPLFGTSSGRHISDVNLHALTAGIDDALQRTVEELVGMGTEHLYEMGQPRPAGIFLSVEEAKPGHVSRGNWRAHIAPRVAHLSASVAAWNVSYGNWLEGEDNRNARFRFPGYGMFRATRTWLDEHATPVLEKHVQHAVNRLNG